VLSPPKEGYSDIDRCKSRVITEEELQRLKEQEEVGLGNTMAALLDVPEPDHEAVRNEFRHRFLSLGLEALRRGEITRQKLDELSQMVHIEPHQLERSLQAMGLDNPEGEEDVLLPKV
jgi:hypothetical protein